MSDFLIGKITQLTDNPIVHKRKTISKRGNKYTPKQTDRDDFMRDFKRRQNEKIQKGK